MTKRKVIEDSDDEDNVVTTPPRRTEAKLSGLDVDNLIGDKDQAESHNVPQSAHPSGGSIGLHHSVPIAADRKANELPCTEQRNHDIRAAHRGLINPSIDGSNPSLATVSSSQRQSETSSTMSRSKLKRAKTGIEKPRTKKALRKYGTESGRDIFEFFGEMDEEMEAAAGRDSVSSTIAGTRTTSSRDTAALTSPDQLQTDQKRALPGPSSMPPPSSKSTSIEQTQILGSNLVAKLPHTEAGFGPEQTQSGVKRLASSSHLDSESLTYTVSTGQSEVECSDASHGVSDPQERAMLNSEVSDPPNVEPSSSASAFSPTRTITVESRANPEGRLIAHHDVNRATSPWKSEENHEPELHKPVVLVPDISHACDVGDELSLPTHGPETWSINQTTMSKAKREKRDSDAPHTEEPGSDDLGIGLPKDQYQPRPSRSRSGRGNEEIIIPTDFSKRPESVNKKKETSSKRRKTTAFQELIPKGDNPDEICVVQKDEPILPVSSPQSQNFEAGSDRHIIQREDQKDSPAKFAPDPISLEKSPAKPTTKKPRGRPKKTTPSEVTDAKPTDAVCSSSDLKREKTKMPQPKDAREGRKMKTAKKDPGLPAKATPLSTELVHDTDDDDNNDDGNDDLFDIDQLEQQQDQVLNNISGNGSPSKTTETAKASSSPIKKNAQPPRTPERSATPNQKGPDKHSPISSAKVAYRVGLSKRARIAPLLRMVRKA